VIERKLSLNRAVRKGNLDKLLGAQTKDECTNQQKFDSRLCKISNKISAKKNDLSILKQEDSNQKLDLNQKINLEEATTNKPLLSLDVKLKEKEESFVSLELPTFSFEKELRLQCNRVSNLSIIA
jgi:hypothetical protein